MFINGYYINDYQGIFYWWLLMAILLVMIDGHFSNGYYMLYYDY
jgi:hypothetical protein